MQCDREMWKWKYVIGRENESRDIIGNCKKEFDQIGDLKIMQRNTTGEEWITVFNHE